MHVSWKDALNSEFKEEYFKFLMRYVNNERKKYNVFPPANLVFNALNTGLNDIKVVIIGQDPYHGKGQAHGLCFSVMPGVTPPPSLKNIFKEIKNDLSLDIDMNYGCLQSWAKQGVFLLNTSLTVREGKPASHANKGWHLFTDKVISTISDRKDPVVFLLWGKHAINKKSIIDSKHLILEAAHPSPMSSHRGFFGCKHFSKTNNWLERMGKQSIDWNPNSW